MASLGNSSLPGWQSPGPSSAKGCRPQLRLSWSSGASLGTRAPAIGITFQEPCDLHDLRDRLCLVPLHLAQTDQDAFVNE